MLIKQQPLRTSFYSKAKFLKLYTLKKNKDNYLFLTRKGKINPYIIINKDKASNYKLCNIKKNCRNLKQIMKN